ncbi:hypothetical protein EN852_035880 [Mesorhizobium sp. M2E.F.Ca.ET.209.01.1.1]|uniref:hypothetical protein n=1 Tax=Mesorhizobium sp. M2E.F.Ca.ET.209.01.1.1 TaxID=2500526 RepID=UPI001092E481|nr:hypothetical protein [Mesorhizobium sp. M2E.F.Ca.ET.209.01.1.1]TGS03268.1 hypothetical protein EN852_035880 [Mesorhizobium sp. M2E.F.Ca.ET.209.01.1.1]
MTRTSIIATAFAALVGVTAVAPAMGNDVNLEQYGWRNSAGGAQHGYRNRVHFHQDGRFNTAIGQQYGHRNLSVIMQQGVNNFVVH